jgi:hypothetical protein
MEHAALMYCLQVDREREGVSGGIIAHGTTIIVRSRISGQPILHIVTAVAERYSNLVTRFTQLCAAVLDVPRLSMHLQWKPPIPMQNVDTTIGSNCDCYQCLAKNGPLLLEATALITPITKKQYTDFARAQSDWDYCLVCCDPAEDLNNYGGDRNKNCVRCTPCSLCDKCNVTIVGERVCLCCIESAEEDLLGSVARRRKLLVDYDDEIDYDDESWLYLA